MRSKVNMTWNNLPCHHIIFFPLIFLNLSIYLLLFRDHEIMNYIFIMVCHENKFKKFGLDCEVML
jgi:hypothetical protein